MAITYTSAKALLAVQATAVSTEATSAGLTSLATALTNLSSEITASSVTENEFFGNGITDSGIVTTKGSVASVWSEIIHSASQIVAAHNSNSIRDNFVPVDSGKFWEQFSGMVSDVSTITGNQTVIANTQSVIADKTTAIETYQKRIKELGETSGVRIRSPYEALSMVTLYKLLIEQATILENIDTVNEQEKAAALAKVKQFTEQLKGFEEF